MERSSNLLVKKHLVSGRTDIWTQDFEHMRLTTEC